ncbi:hypothetical protein CERSUDRAFT_101668 [Gelatoporia subvermispora B]|uniref:Uncharacterized protein n=1 Tax=Ceriporiopsis subvermispora (strain B) TaxID=914234 RepID=M2QWD0_CERS8|nr:hypothetical protein CERSUDRAFT_101668 [Gelatoporia subvermispora B]
MPPPPIPFALSPQRLAAATIAPPLQPVAGPSNSVELNGHIFCHLPAHLAQAVAALPTLMQPLRITHTIQHARSIAPLFSPINTAQPTPTPAQPTPAQPAPAAAQPAFAPTPTQPASAPAPA